MQILHTVWCPESTSTAAHQTQIEAVNSSYHVSVQLVRFSSKKVDENLASIFDLCKLGIHCICTIYLFNLLI